MRQVRNSDGEQKGKKKSQSKEGKEKEKVELQEEGERIQSILLKELTVTLSKLVYL